MDKGGKEESPRRGELEKSQAPPPYMSLALAERAEGDKAGYDRWRGMIHISGAPVHHPGWILRGSRLVRVAAGNIDLQPNVLIREPHPLQSPSNNKTASV